ncbi:cation:proton antiporter [Candidatus Woesearchaeota archaeon]|nr:cation:proton antiporter [Candidatus Woesearchaeota archaeon]
MAALIEQLGILLIIVVVISFIIKLLKQPIILGYVLSGLFFAWYLSDYQNIYETMILFGEIGIIFMLFLLGIEFDLKSLKYLGKDIFITTILQSIFLFAISLGITIFFPLTWMERVHIGIVLLFSSTLFVAKWVEDKKETAALHGKIIFSTLIIQDILAILAITLLSLFNKPIGLDFMLIPLKGILLLGIGFIVSRFLIQRILKTASHFIELLFILSISFCFMFAILAQKLGYSETIGAFLGGIVLGNTIYKTEIYGRLKPLTIFFNMLFFVGLGFQMLVPLNPKTIVMLALLLAATLFIKPFIFYITLRMRGYDLKTALLSGLYLAQNSEFGVIIVVGSISSGIISSQLGALSIILVITSMILSSYLIKYDREIFQWCSSWLLMLDRLFATTKTAKLEEKAIDAEIIFFGYYEFGSEVLDKIKALNKKIIVIENDPHLIEKLQEEKIPFIFDSVYSPEFFRHHHFKNPELVISNKMDLIETKIILKELKSKHPSIKIMVTARNINESLELYNAQADYVIYPTYVNEKQVTVLVEDYIMDINKVISRKVVDLVEFNKKAKEQEIRAKKEGFLDVNSFLKKQEVLYKKKQEFVSEVDNFLRKLHIKK